MVSAPRFLSYKMGNNNYLFQINPFPSLICCMNIIHQSMSALQKKIKNCDDDQTVHREYNIQ